MSGQSLTSPQPSPEGRGRNQYASSPGRGGEGQSPPQPPGRGSLSHPLHPGEGYGPCQGEGKAQPSTPPPAFDVRSASFSYSEGLVAVKDASLVVQPGERVAILGANGCGKSTLLKLLDGLYFPGQGEVYAFGQKLSEAAFQEEGFHFGFRRRVGLLFQDSDVQLFSPSVWDEVAFAPLQMGLVRDEVIERVESALKTLRIEGLRDRAPHRLSGGEKKRRCG
jgi:cobalt/nickel transport system ATP-binding protein